MVRAKFIDQQIQIQSASFVRSHLWSFAEIRLLPAALWAALSDAWCDHTVCCTQCIQHDPIVACHTSERCATKRGKGQRQRRSHVAPCQPNTCAAADASAHAPTHLDVVATKNRVFAQCIVALPFLCKTDNQQPTSKQQTMRTCSIDHTWTQTGDVPESRPFWATCVRETWEDAWLLLVCLLWVCSSREFSFFIVESSNVQRTFEEVLFMFLQVCVKTLLV